MFPTVVIGLDPSSTSHQACRTGFELAKQLGAHVHLVTAFSDSRLGGFEITPERKSAEHTVEGMAAECDPTGRMTTTHALPGNPAPAIVDIAERVDADLIVIGNKGTHGALRVLGSVASAVTNQSPCTVMVVKTT